VLLEIAEQENEMGTVAPQTVAEWLESGDSINPLHNLAVANARCANALARALNLQKLTVEDISDHINRISDLITRINLYKTTKTGPTDTEPLGKDVADAIAILDQLELEGVDKTKIDTFRAQITQTGLRPNVLASDISFFTTALQGKSESLSNKSQQEQLRLQTFTNRYTQASDQASTALQKNAQSIGTVTNNFR
jgi:hypothetical protein